MTTDNKTLADVQPGGRVRLGDGPTIEKQARELLAAEHRKCDRNTEADLVLAGDVTVLGQIALNAIIAALSAQPSAGGQCAHELWAMAQLVPGEGIEDGVRRIEAALAARQPVDSCTESECKRCRAHPDHRASLEHAGISDFRQPVTMDDALAAGDGTLHGAIDHWQERALRAEAELAARQPVGEPVGEVFWDNETGEISVTWLNGDLPPGIGTLLYDAPPAQAVDLGQLRGLAGEMDRFRTKWKTVSIAEFNHYADRLLALIDSQGVQS